VKKHFFVLLCALFSFKLQAQQFGLSGKITDQNQQPLMGVRVTLHPGNNELTTDSRGYFRFTGLDTGYYQLLANLHAFKTLDVKLVLHSKDVELSLILYTLQHQLKEVVINDRRAELLHDEESLNVEVVKAEYIQRNLGGSLMKSLERLPGIKTIGIGSGQSKPLVRGLGFNRVVVVDRGVKHEGQAWGADHGLEIDQFAATEIELIKGAASFIYGSDAIAGAIAIKAAAVPAAHTSGGTISIIGKTNNNLLGTSVNLFARNQRWFFDARVTYQGYGDYRVPEDQVFVYDYAVKLNNHQLRNTAGNETAFHLNTGYVHNQFRTVFYLSNTFSKSGFFANAHGLEPRRVDEVVHDASSRDILMPSQEVNHLKLLNHSSYHLPGHHLEMDMGYQHNFRQEYSQYVNHGYMPAVYPSDLGIPSGLEREFDKRVYSFNVRDHMVLGRHDIKTGASFEQQHNDIYGWSFLVPAFRQSTVGAFIYDKYKISDKFLFHAALRYDHSRLNMFAYQDWFASTITSGGTAFTEKLSRAENLNRSFNSLVWSAGINYNQEGGLSLKANFGKSFRMPIAKELAANGVNYHYFSYERGNPDLSAEQSYQADLGITYTGDRLSLQLSPFYNYFPNYIYLNPTSAHDYFYGAGNQVFQYAQSKVARYGAELQFNYKLFKTLSAEVLGEYLYARQLSGDKKGYTLPFSPPASVLFNLTWSPQSMHYLNGSYFSIDYRITAPQNNIVPPEKKTPGYKIINIQAGSALQVQGRPMTLNLQVQNVLNTKYLNHTSFYRLIELPEAGRNIILSLRIPFDVSTKSK
jgi:iron complex outermembrane receptor protein